MEPHFAGFWLVLETFDTPAQLSGRVLAQGVVVGGRPPSLLVLVDLQAFPHAEAFAILSAGEAEYPLLVCLGQTENLRHAWRRCGWVRRLGSRAT